MAGCPDRPHSDDVAPYATRGARSGIRPATARARPAAPPHAEPPPVRTSGGFLVPRARAGLTNCADPLGRQGPDLRLSPWPGSVEPHRTPTATCAGAGRVGSSRVGSGQVGSGRVGAMPHQLQGVPHPPPHRAHPGHTYLGNAAKRREQVRGVPAGRHGPGSVLAGQSRATGLHSPSHMLNPAAPITPPHRPGAPRPEPPEPGGGERAGARRPGPAGLRPFRTLAARSP